MKLRIIIVSINKSIPEDNFIRHGGILASYLNLEMNSDVRVNCCPNCSHKRTDNLPELLSNLNECANSTVYVDHNQYQVVIQFQVILKQNQMDQMLVILVGTEPTNYTSRQVMLRPKHSGVLRFVCNCFMPGNSIVGERL